MTTVGLTSVSGRKEEKERKLFPNKNRGGIFFEKIKKRYNENKKKQSFHPKKHTSRFLITLRLPGIPG